MDQVWHNHTTYKELVAKCEQVLDVSGIVKRVITCTDNLGDNVIKDPKTLTWEPKTMVELLDWYDVIPHNRPMYQARMSIAHKEGFGMLDSGYLNSGQQVLVNDKKTHIKIKRINGQSGIRTAYGGESIEFDLDGKDIHVGDVISNCDRPVKYDKEFVAKFILLAPVDIKNKEKITLHINNISAKAWIDGILMIENPTDGKLIQDKYSPVAGECFIGRIKTDDKIPFEHVKEFFTFGRFVLARGEEIVAVGSIVPNASQEWPHDNQRTAEAA